MYNWQFEDWPNFTYSVEKLQEISVIFAQEIGLVNGLVMGLNNQLKTETLLEILVMEAIKTSEIEGEYMEREDVMSSIKNNLGLTKAIPIKDKRAIGITQLMVEINHDVPKQLTQDLICHWHEVLMAYNKNISIGVWRFGLEPMQVVSGSFGREVVHYEAPPSVRVPAEMEKFISWFHHAELSVKDNVSAVLLKTAIAHLYFESIHPFEDGNGRIGRLLAEYTLAQGFKDHQLLLSLSKTIEKEKKTYYKKLKAAQRTLDITEWINYFSEVILEAQIDARKLILFTLQKAKFFDRYTSQINNRQMKVINRILENGTTGFEGGMSAKKYMTIAKTSKATATRDLQQLFEIGAFERIGSGRSVSYQLVLTS